MRGGYYHNHQSAIEGGVMYCSSPSDTSLIKPLTPPPTQSANMDDIQTSTKRGAMSGTSSFTPTMEGTSMVPDGVGSTSSRSDCSEFDHSGKLHLSTPRNFPSCRSFMSKPIHPLSFPIQAPSLETSGLLEYGPTLIMDTRRPSSDISSIDLADIFDHFEPDYPARSSSPCGPHKCGVCDRLLSQRSPWSSRRIVKSGDMPVAGILSCRHVFHAECLEQSIPNSNRSDPPCPICVKIEGENPPNNLSFTKHAIVSQGLGVLVGRVHQNLGQVGDCVEGAHKSSMLVLNRSKIKKNLSLKGNLGKDFPSKPKKSGSYPLSFFGGRLVDHGAGPSIKK